MRRACRAIGLLAVLALGPATAPGAEIPIEAIRDWAYQNDRGWRALLREEYPRAEEAFREAIRAILPYDVRDRRLLARSYGDLARVLYHEGQYAQAEPLARWSLLVREAHPKLNPDAVYQSLYLLAAID